MQKFRKKPIVIEAMQFTSENAEAVEKWCSGYHCYSGTIHQHSATRQEYNDLVIETLEGRMIASYGDWVIQGIKGEFYPCKNDIFLATYEAVTDAEQEKDEAPHLCELSMQRWNEGHEVGFNRGLREKS